MPKFKEVDRKELSIFENTVGRFAEEIRKKGRRQILGADGYWIRPLNAASLLELRKDLRDGIRQGMLQRKDMEVEIALYAMLVWYHRQEMEKATRMRLEDIAIQEENEDPGEREAWDAVRQLGQD